MSKRLLRIWRGGPEGSARLITGPVFEDSKFDVEEAMMFLKPEINVSGDFEIAEEVEEYRDLARGHGYEVEVIRTSTNDLEPVTDEIINTNPLD
jgi:hypothetical protein